MAPSLATSLRWIAITISFCAVFATAVISPLIGTAADEGDDAKDIEIAKSLAAMLSAGLTVISRNQVLIDSPDIEDKGLDGKTVLEQARKVYMDATGSDPSKIDPSSRHARLLEVEMNAIVDVMNAHQRELNQRGVGFKGVVVWTARGPGGRWTRCVRCSRVTPRSWLVWRPTRITSIHFEPLSAASVSLRGMPCTPTVPAVPMPALRF